MCEDCTEQHLLRLLIKGKPQISGRTKVPRLQNNNVQETVLVSHVDDTHESDIYATVDVDEGVDGENQNSTIVIDRHCEFLDGHRQLPLIDPIFRRGKTSWKVFYYRDTSLSP